MAVTEKPLPPGTEQRQLLTINIYSGGTSMTHIHAATEDDQQEAQRLQSLIDDKLTAIFKIIKTSTKGA